MKLESLGEFGLIDRIQKILGKPTLDMALGIGDDAAILPAQGESELVYASDSMVEGVHFDRSYFPPEAIGWKSLAVNLSDLAAMCAKPLAALTSLTLPESWSVEEVDSLYLGMSKCSKTYRCPVLGGDTTRSVSEAVITVSVIGTVKRGEAVLRNTASEGDLICVTGSLGNSRTGFELLSSGKDEDGFKDAVSRFLSPEPQLKMAEKLKKHVLPTAMLDISDGLEADLMRLCQSSRVGCVIEAESVPVADDCKKWTGLNQHNLQDFFLQSGEEYELLFTIDPQYRNRLQQINEEAGPVSVIGKITGRSDGSSIVSATSTRELEGRGWNHFKAGDKD